MEWYLRDFIVAGGVGEAQRLPAELVRVGFRINDEVAGFNDGNAALGRAAQVALGHEMMLREDAAALTRELPALMERIFALDCAAL